MKQPLATLVGLTLALALALALGLGLGPGAALAQGPWPDKPDNLKVLPETISKQELRRTMVGFAQALGVRCVHCHVAEDPQDLSTFDFAADDKPAKNTARIMLEMVGAINGTHLSKVDRDDRLSVSCITCHRGQPRPQQLDDLLLEVATGEGVEAAIAKYRELRDELYGSSSFDFREGSLNRLGYRLMGAERVGDAIEIFKLNAELFPESANVHDSLGEAYMESGDKERAVESYRKSLELDPENRNAAQMLEKLGG